MITNKVVVFAEKRYAIVHIVHVVSDGCVLMFINI